MNNEGEGLLALSSLPLVPIKKTIAYPHARFQTWRCGLVRLINGFIETYLLLGDEQEYQQNHTGDGAAKNSDVQRR